MQALKRLLAVCPMVLSAQFSLAAIDSSSPLVNPGIKATTARTIHCPVKLDLSGIKKQNDLHSYLKEQSLAELPYKNMKEKMIGIWTDIPFKNAPSSLTNDGGVFVINQDGHSVSQFVCKFTDNTGNKFTTVFLFRSDLKFHVSEKLPSYPDERLFEPEGLIDGKQLPCAAINDNSDTSRPHCKLTPAFFTLTNNIKIHREKASTQKNTSNYGKLQYYSALREEIPESLPAVAPGATHIIPMSPGPESSAIEIEVTAYGRTIKVQDLCIDSWLPDQAFSAEYGSSPHIIISGTISDEGNTVGGRDDVFNCELRCSENPGKQSCWGINLGTYFNYYFFSKGVRPDLAKLHLISHLPNIPGVNFIEMKNEELREHIKRVYWVNKLEQKPVASDLKVPTKMLEEQYHRKVLGLDANDGLAEAKKIVRELGKQYHPDKCKAPKRLCEKNEKLIKVCQKKKNDPNKYEKLKKENNDGWKECEEILENSQKIITECESIYKNNEKTLAECASKMEKILEADSYFQKRDEL